MEMMSSTDNIATTTRPTGGDNGGIGCTPQNITNASGILKLFEILFSLIVIICVTQDKEFLTRGGGWVMFVAVSALLVVLAMFIIYLLNIIARMPSWWCLLEFIYYTVFTVLYVTSCIACAAADHHPKKQAALDAATVFSFLTTILYHVDTFLKYRDYKLGRDEN